MKKLSIITINKDNIAGLQQTMQSVFSQTWQGFEYIVIDGGSTDGSVEVIRQCADKITYWISELDVGVFNAMNKGIRQTKGEYLLFLNSGDFLVDENVLSSVFATEHKADILCARCNVSDKGVVVCTFDAPEKITFGTLYFAGLAHQSTFVKRCLFDKLGLYREDFKYNADVEFWYRSIILGGATTERLNQIITDYNLDGISNRESKTETYKQEMQQIFNNPKLQLFAPDYEKWKQERNEMKILYWAKSQSLLYAFVKLMHQIAIFCIKIKKR